MTFFLIHMRLNRQRVLSGIKWSSVNLLLCRALSFISKIYLASLIAPEHFGLMTTAIVAIGLVQNFSDLGLKSALIQKKKDAISKERYSSAFWVLVIAGILLTSLAATFGSYLVSAFYSEPLLATVVSVMSISILLSNLSILPTVLLSRSLKFKYIILSDLLAVFLGVSTAISFAIAGFGIWALVAQFIIAQLVNMFALFSFSKWVPRRLLVISSLFDVKSFSGYAMGMSAVHFLRKNMDYILVGKLLGATPLGLYTLAYTLTEAIREQLLNLIAKVMFPAYSRLQSSPESIKPYYLKTLRYSALITFPFCTFLILYAGSVVNTFFSEEWSGIQRPLQVLSLASMIFVLSGTSSEVLRAIGLPKTAFRISILNTIFVAIPLLYFGIKIYGLEGAAWATVIHFTVHRIAYHIAIREHLKLTELDVLVAILPALIVTAFMSLIAYFAPNLSMLLALSSTFVILSLVVCWLLWRNHAYVEDN